MFVYPPGFVIQSITLLIEINTVTKAISNVLAGLSERVEVLEKKHRAFGLQETATNDLTEITSGVPIPSENTKNSQTAIPDKKRKGVSEGVTYCCRFVDVLSSKGSWPSVDQKRNREFAQVVRATSAPIIRRN
jgi:hypothetical protein